VALPGVPNVHSHAFQRAMAGLTENAGPGADSFWTWRNLMYRFVERLDPEDLEAISAFAFAEMLEAGFTRVGEFTTCTTIATARPTPTWANSAARIAAAAQDTGIGLPCCRSSTRTVTSAACRPRGPRRFINDLDGFARLLEASRRAVQALDAARVGVAPHSLRAVTLRSSQRSCRSPQMRRCTCTSPSR